MSNRPLVVDLDGTLVRSDLLVETWFSLLGHRPLTAMKAVLWVFRGRAYLKQQIAARVILDVTTLPYHDQLIEFLRAQHDEGRRLVLASASDERLVTGIAGHLGIFERVLASDGLTNLAGASKRDRLLKEFGAKDYDYAGNALADLPVWAEARKAIVVDPTRGLRAAVARTTEIERVFEDDGERFTAILRAVRMHQWAKNLLIFVPLLASHQIGDLSLVFRTLVAFLAFGLCASGSYILNDLLDLESDRRHPEKRRRPIASGSLPARQGLMLVLPLVGAGLAVGAVASAVLPAILLLYLASTLAYSIYVKHVALIDVFWLAGLYTLRIIAGAAVAVLWPSAWLLAFSMFLFLSLALLKRHTELVNALPGTRLANDRGYRQEDSELLAALGSASGYIAVLVAGLYITSDAARLFYDRPGLLWGPCVLLLYWISRMWLLAHRRMMSSDPVAFAVRDGVTWGVLALSTICMIAAT
jgi:4-hydroxybenzoate polyprenyltransferase